MLHAGRVASGRIGVAVAGKVGGRIRVAVRSEGQLIVGVRCDCVVQAWVATGWWGWQGTAWWCEVGR